MSNQTEYFTVVFRGDVRKLGFNPLSAKTPYGEVVGVAVGDCLTELWELQDGESDPELIEPHPPVSP
jgi:hypothetical protein